MKLTPWPVAIAGLVVIGASAAAYVLFSAPGKPAGADLTQFAVGEMADLVVRADAPEQPGKVFRDAAGAEVSLAEFRGKTVLVNLWATWCAPCVKELPALDRLQAALGGEAFQVVAVSLDRDVAKAKAFYAENGIGALAFYSDASMSLGAQLDTPGLPTTVLYDETGRERARLVRDAEWDSPEAEALVRFVMNEAAGAEG